MSDKFDIAIHDIKQEYEGLKQKCLKLMKKNETLETRVEQLEKEKASLKSMVNSFVDGTNDKTTISAEANDEASRKRQRVECTSSQLNENTKNKTSGEERTEKDPFYHSMVQQHSESESIRSSDDETEGVPHAQIHKARQEMMELMSPTKTTPVRKSHNDAKNCDSPFYNSQIPTQYSDNASPTVNPDDTGNFKESGSSPKEISQGHIPAEEIIEDSEDETNSLIFVKSSPLKEITNRQNIRNSKPLTTLQKRSHTIEYFIKKFKEDAKYVVNLSINPITEMHWVLGDFKPNPHYCKPKSTKRIPFSRQQQEERFGFYKLADQGLPDLRHPEFELEESQVLDKLPSPPGFMISDFPTTQEQKHRKDIVKQRQKDRLKRRLSSCLMVRENGAPQQIGEFVFVHNVLNQYVISNRYKPS